MPKPLVVNKKMLAHSFDGAASSYDLTGPSIFTQFGNRLVEQIPLAHGSRVLDVATGKGATLFPMARQIRSEGQVVGIDLSRGMLQEAERAVRVEGLTNVELIKMDAEHLEFSDQTFDTVLCAFGLFLFPDMAAALREMYRVTKPGGNIGVSLFGKTPFPFDPAWPILIQQLSPYISSGPMPQIAYAPKEVETLLSQFGFISIEVNSETNDIIYTSEEDWWAFQLTLAFRGAILGMDEETRARFKDEYLTKLRPMFRQDGLHLSLTVIYAIARR